MIDSCEYGPRRACALAVLVGVAVLAACLMSGAPAWALGGADKGESAAAASAPAGPAPAGKAVGAPTRYMPERGAIAERHYKIVWGIDTLRVKTVESGQMIRFSWRVLDPQKAGALNDKKIEPALIAPDAGVSLVVPAMENIGQLRQVAPPQAGKSYWMAFSNKGHVVKPGDRVSVVIGPFRADGLVVD